MIAGNAPARAQQPLLRLRGVTKAFGPVQALTGIDLDIVQNMPLGHEVRRRGLLGPVTDYDTSTAVHWMTTGDGSPNSTGQHRRTLSEELS